MTLVNWFKRIFGKGEKPVALAEQAGEPADEGSGKRKLHLDGRLLPKEKAGLFRWPPVPKKVLLSRQEAARFYSPSMASGNVALRRIATDPVHLTRYGLPHIKSEAELADFLGLTPARLAYYACYRADDAVDHYVSFRVPKRSGGTRLIMAPKAQLRALQRVLLRELVDNLPVSDYAHGFRKGRSIRTNAEPHRGKKFVLRFDLADFFGSVTFFRVRGYLVSLGYAYPVATSLALLMTASERQPIDLGGQVVFTPVGARHCVQGAPTSPGLCNALACRLDHRLAGLARRYGFRYTRYADDLTFSGDDERAIGPLLSVVEEIVQSEGFALNPTKTRVMRASQHQRVTGVTVNEVVGLSRQERRKIRATIHRLQKERAAGRARPEEVARLEGMLAYVEMLNAEQGAVLRRQWTAT